MGACVHPNVLAGAEGEKGVKLGWDGFLRWRQQASSLALEDSHPSYGGLCSAAKKMPLGAFGGDSEVVGVSEGALQMSEGRCYNPAFVRLVPSVGLIPHPPSLSFSFADQCCRERSCSCLRWSLSGGLETPCVMKSQLLILQLQGAKFCVSDNLLSGAC